MIWAAALFATAAPTCTTPVAVRTTVEEIAAAPEKWFDRCVRLDGYVSGYHFYSDARGYYRSHAADRDDHLNDGWLGLYFADRGELRKPAGRISLVGVVNDCERSYKAATAAAGPNTLIMMSGYCHYQGGLTLNHVRVISRSSDYIERQTGEAARRAFGDLELPDAAHPPPKEAQVLVAQFEDAFAANDKGKLLSIAGPYFSNVETASEKRDYEALVSGARGPLQSFRRAGKLPRPQWFYARPAKGQDDISDWFACYCRDSSCEGSWPIAALDAVSSPDFPYACLRVFNYNQMGPKLSVDVIDEPYGS